MSLPFAVRLRAHAAGLEEVVTRIDAGGRDAADLLALAAGPLPLLAAMAAEVAPKDARVVGLLPYGLGTPPEKALAHRAAAEAEVIALRATEGSLDDACAALQTLRAALRGAVGRVDTASLAHLAKGAGISAEEAAARLAEAGVTELEILPGDAKVAGLAPTFVVVAPAAIDRAFVDGLLSCPPSSLSLRLDAGATGVVLLRAVALARLAGHGPIAVGGADELKGPDACLAFGADRLEALLDPPGSMGSRTRAYGEAAVRGSQLQLIPPRRRAAAGKAVAHILDEHVDPESLPGGDIAAPLPVVAHRAPEVRS